MTCSAIWIFSSCDFAVGGAGEASPVQPGLTARVARARTDAGRDARLRLLLLRAAAVAGARGARLPEAEDATLTTASEAHGKRKATGVWMGWCVGRGGGCGCGVCGCGSVMVWTE